MSKPRRTVDGNFPSGSPAGPNEWVMTADDGGPIGARLIDSCLDKRALDFGDLKFTCVDYVIVNKIVIAKVRVLQ